MTWVVVLGLVWGNPDSRVVGVGDVVKIERIEVATEAQCQRAARDWTYTNNYLGKGSGYSAVTATCAGQKPEMSGAKP